MTRPAAARQRSDAASPTPARRAVQAPSATAGLRRSGTPSPSRAPVDRVPEASGGPGGTLADAAGRPVAGRHAAPIPLAETGVLAGWLAVGRAASRRRPDHRRARARRRRPPLRWGTLHGTARRVPWAREPQQWSPSSTTGRRRLPGTRGIDPLANVAGEPRDSVNFDGADPDLVGDAPDGVDEKRPSAGRLTRSRSWPGRSRRCHRWRVHEGAHAVRQAGRAVPGRPGTAREVRRGAAIPPNVHVGTARQGAVGKDASHRGPHP